MYSVKCMPFCLTAGLKEAPGVHKRSLAFPVEYAVRWRPHCRNQNQHQGSVVVDRTAGRIADDVPEILGMPDSRIPLVSNACTCCTCCCTFGNILLIVGSNSERETIEAATLRFSLIHCMQTFQGLGLALGRTPQPAVQLDLKCWTAVPWHYVAEFLLICAAPYVY
jgi:hypothetical protein